jgi:hypothetical protein
MANGMFAGGTGTISDPILIEDAADLDAMRRNLSASYKLINNINLGAAPYNIGKGWQPIQNFTGTFNGNNKKIVNLYINRSEEDNVGLFGRVSVPKTKSALTFYDFGIDNASVSGRSNVGILAGLIYVTGGEAGFNPVIARLFVAGKVEAAGNSIGGMIGAVNGDNLAVGAGAPSPFSFGYDLISKCDLLLNSQVATKYMGGIIGYNLITGWYSRYGDWYAYAVTCAFLTRTIGLCTFSTTDNVKTGYPIFSPVSTNVCDYSRFINCFYDSTIHGGNPSSSGTVPLTTNEFFDASSKLLPLRDEHYDGNQTVWQFKVDQYPQLWFTNQACYFVKAGNDYLTYDPSQKKWVKQFDALPSTPVILSKGMPDISTLDTNAWSQLKQYGTIDIANFLESTENLSVSNAKIDLVCDALQTDPGMISYRREIKFADYNNDIASVIP